MCHQTYPCSPNWSWLGNGTHWLLVSNISSKTYPLQWQWCSFGLGIKLQSHILDQDSNPWPWTDVRQAMPLNHRRSFWHRLPPKTRNFPVSTKFFGTQSCFISKNFNESGFFCQKMQFTLRQYFEATKNLWYLLRLLNYWESLSFWKVMVKILSRLFLRAWDLMESFPIFYPLTH